MSCTLKFDTSTAGNIGSAACVLLGNEIDQSNTGIGVLALTDSCPEYCRIVWDIFPEDKNIRFVVAGPQPELLNGWQVKALFSSELSRWMAKACLVVVGAQWMDGKSLSCRRRQMDGW